MSEWSIAAMKRAAHAVELIAGTHCGTCEAQFSFDPEEIARAVLRAIREPTNEMIGEGAQVLMDDRSPEPPCPLAEAVYRAMIDAALAE